MSVLIVSSVGFLIPNNATVVEAHHQDLVFGSMVMAMVVGVWMALMNIVVGEEPAREMQHIFYL